MHADAAPRSSTHGNESPAAEPMAYTIPGAAKALSLSERKVAQLVAEGAIESIKIDRSRRIPRAALLAYIESLRAVA